MMYPISTPAGMVAFWFLACASPSFAHTWVEELRLVSSNGSFVGASGYPRGFGPRTAGIDPNLANVYKIPINGQSTIRPTDLMCKSTQTTQTQTSGYPRLVAAPGDRVAMRYEENGHVTLFTTQDGKPEGRGTVFIYATTKSAPTDTYLGIHKVWNQDGTGGDGRGKLIAAQPFDDGQCFQINDGPTSTQRQAASGWSKTYGDLMCQNDIVIPADAGTSGAYTLYWVWDWPTLDRAGNIFTNESYTSCMDIDLTSTAVSTVGKAVAFPNGISGVALNAAAAPSQVTNVFRVDPPFKPKIAADNPFTQPGSAPVPVPVATSASSPASATSPSAPAAKPTTPAPSPSAPAAKPTTPAPAMITVTVTDTANFTVTVTKDVPKNTATAMSTPTVLTTMTVIPVPSTPAALNPSVAAPASSLFLGPLAHAPAATTALASDYPAVTPFLTPSNSIVQEAGRKMAIRGRAVNFLA